MSKQICVWTALIRLTSCQQEILLDTKGQYMRELSFIAGNATIKQHQKEILLDTKEQCMMESHFLAGNATIKQHKKEVLLDTKRQHMKELDFHAGIVLNNILLGKIWQSTKEIYIFNSPAWQKVCTLYENIEKL